MREIELLSHPILPIYLPAHLVQDVLNMNIVSVSHQSAGRERDPSLAPQESRSVLAKSLVNC